MQHLTHLLLDCPASESLCYAIFGTTSIFLHLGQTLGHGPTVGSLWSSFMPQLLGRGQVVPPLFWKKFFGVLIKRLSHLDLLPHPISAADMLWV